jgi:hypothetical protein
MPMILLAVYLLAAPPPIHVDVSSALYAQVKPATTGLVVVAMGDAADAAWPLAQAMYLEPGLRPQGLDEATARVLAGEAPPEKAPKQLVDLAQMRASVHGDDAASRVLLQSIAHSTNASGVVIVDASAQPFVARVYVAGKDAFEAVRYSPDAAPPGTRTAWSAAVQLLARTYGSAASEAPTSTPSSTPGAALWEGPSIERSPARSHNFYESPWFWGALGAAAFIGGAFFFATRDNNASTIHLQVEVPK